MLPAALAPPDATSPASDFLLLAPSPEPALFFDFGVGSKSSPEPALDNFPGLTFLGFSPDKAAIFAEAVMTEDAAGSWVSFFSISTSFSASFPVQKSSSPAAPSSKSPLASPPHRLSNFTCFYQEGVGVVMGPFSLALVGLLLVTTLFAKVRERTLQLLGLRIFG